VSGLIRQAALLPGGAYNYGSENALTMFETGQWLKDALSLPVNITDAGKRHHLWMDCSRIKSQGIYFCNTIDGLKKCIRDYNL
jgi:dTDP-4-dehydrorhamnose reductase